MSRSIHDDGDDLGPMLAARARLADARARVQLLADVVTLREPTPRYERDVQTAAELADGALTTLDRALETARAELRR